MSLRRTTPRPATQWTGDTAPKPRGAALRMRDHTARLVVTLPKFDYVRDKALLIACRTLPCQHCGTSDGTICAAHSNEAVHGKGRGIKASDEFVAALCFACHHQLDQGAFLSRAGRVAMWRAAHGKTKALLIEAGMWPAGISETGV